MVVSNRLEVISAINQDFFNGFEEIKGRLDVLEGRSAAAVGVGSSDMLEAIEKVVESKLKETQELNKSVKDTIKQLVVKVNE